MILKTYITLLHSSNKNKLIRLRLSVCKQFHCSLLRFIKAALLSVILFFPVFVFCDDQFTNLSIEARKLTDQGRYSESLTYLKKMNVLRPYDEPTSFRYATSLIYQEKENINYKKDLTIAIKLLTRSITLLDGDPESLTIRFFYLGLAYWYLDKSDEALSAFRQSFRAKANLASQYNISIILRETGKIPEAQLIEKRLPD